jgi:hypothetical protein
MVTEQFKSLNRRRNIHRQGAEREAQKKSAAGCAWGPPERMRVRRCPAVAIALTPQYPSFRSIRRFFPMAEHGTVEYATATGNDYAAHEQGYESFVHFTLVGILYVVTVVFGLATGGVMGHWLLAAAIFVIGLLGAIPGLLSRATTPSYVAFVICFLIFAFTGLSPR